MKLKILNEKSVKWMEHIGVVMRVIAFGTLSIMGPNTPFLITIIVLFPVILIAACGISIYWVCKFPFWYIERRKWYRKSK